MQGFFAAILAAITGILRVLSNRIIGQWTRDVSSALWAAIRWILLLLLFLAIEYGLYELGKSAGLQTFLSRFPEWGRPYYLPLLGLFIILLCLVLFFYFLTWDSAPQESPVPHHSTALPHTL